MTTVARIMLGASLILALGIAQAAVIAPDELIRNTVSDVISIVKQDKDIQSGDMNKINALVNEKVLPHFDFQRMTQLAVGRYWRTASEEQKKQLVDEFRGMLVRTYTKVFTVYRDQTIEVKPLRMAPGDTEATVKTVISKPGTQSVLVDYEMKEGADSWKVFDISIEGVSMVMSYRGTFASQIQQGGIDGLIKTLSDKNTDATDAAVAKAGTK